jgi:hypothetical protein
MRWRPCKIIQNIKRGGFSSDHSCGIPPSGYFVGIYASAGTYDLRLFPRDNDDMGYLSNLSFSGGVTAGYSFPLSGRWGLELHAGLGYLGGEYHKYNYGDGNGVAIDQGNSKMHYIGPTGIGVDIIYHIK